MENIKIKRTDTFCDYSVETSLEASDLKFLNKDLVKTLFGSGDVENRPRNCEKTVEGTKTVIHDNKVKEETVVVYDNTGIPSVMRKFSRITNAELFGGSDKPHPAFVIGGEVYDNIYISVYPNCNINGKPYSLPFQKLWTNITNDDAAQACCGKGDGWHLMTAAEWGLVANISLKNGTLPHGNTNCGKYNADDTEKGVTYDDYRTLAGSGPVTWTHNHQADGIHDLCGNVWEMVRGLRIKDGQLQAAANNDAAMDIDLSEQSAKWEAVTDNNGNAIYVSVHGDEITITTDRDIEQDYDGSEWGNVTVNCESEQLKALALFNGESNAYLYADSTNGERFPLRGGHWGDGASAGVFSVSFGDPRSYVNTRVGFRSAYYKKH